MKKTSDNQIHKFSQTIDAHRVVIYCQETLSIQAEYILKVIKEEQKKKKILKDGYKIQMGWSMFFIVESEQEFVLHAPNYAKDPFKDITRDISMALIIQMEQNDILRETKTQGMPVSFQDTMIILKDALAADDLYLVRQASQKASDSGWYLGLLKDNNKGRHTQNDYVSVYTYQLLEFKPELMKLLALPVGCMAVIKENKIFEIVDGDNNRIL